ncbi:MAG TPA: prephenate dehydrogenase/arogenate dehydrogenase family protein [Acidobacteriota bacterium]|nr:prephenate dehydrogenase/arogenate dehydrogenase family protein [Acidobacteriota bacterium]
MLFQQIGIVGVGLIGGSMGLAIKRSLPRVRLLGIGRNSQRLKLAREMGAIDDWQIESDADFRECDLVVLATPVEHILSILRTLGSRLRPGTIVTDVGSTKRRICSQAWDHFPPGVTFIGGHPVAGKEVTGVENCIADLFVGAPYVLCPKPAAASDDLDRLGRMVSGLGAFSWIMSPEKHDRTLAVLSHLPQLLSTALANLSGEEKLEIAGSGFRDMTRLAGSSFSVWRSILETNQDMVDQALGEFIEALERIRIALRTEDLSTEFARASEVYSRLKSGGRQ